MRTPDTTSRQRIVRPEEKMGVCSVVEAQATFAPNTWSYELDPRLLTRREQGNIFDIRQGNTIGGGEVVDT